MENNKIKRFCETCSSNADSNSNQNEQCLNRFLKTLNIEEFEFKGCPSARVNPPVAKDTAVQTDIDLLSIAPPRLIYIGNKVNKMCKELSELMKSISKTDCKKNQNPSNCDVVDAEETVNIGTVDHIEEKIETSLKIVLELKNNLTSTARDSQSTSGTPPVNGVPLTKVISRRETAKNKNLKLNPFDVDEVFPRISRTPQMPFNIFCDKNQRDLGRARAVVAPTRGGTNIINNAIRHPEGHFFCSTPKNSVPVRSQNSDLPKVPPKPQSSNPVPKGVSRRFASVQKKPQTQINPQKPPWR